MSRTSVAKGIKKILALGCSVLLLLSCLYGTIWNSGITFFDLLALVLPYLVIANFILGFVAALARSRLLILPLSSLVIWFFTLGPFLVFSSGDVKADFDDISVLSYNVQGFDGNYRNPYPDVASRITDFINGQEAEIACLQEFANTRLVREKMKNYPHAYRYSFNGRYSPLAIFSKYPILADGSLNFPDTSNNAIYADLLVQGDTIRVYNVHLQSLQFRAGSIKRENPVRLFKRLGNTIRTQKSQVEMLYGHSRNSPYPYIICGDINNTQYSRVYRRLKRDLKDTYLEKGNGLGTTLLFKFLPFRIDYILTAQDFEVTEHQNFDIDYSDHYPVKASFRLPPR